MTQAQDTRLQCRLTGLRQSPRGTMVLEVSAPSTSKYPIYLDVDNTLMEYLGQEIGAALDLGLSAKKLKANKPDDGSFNNYYWSVSSDMRGAASSADAPPARQPAPSAPQVSSLLPAGFQAPQGQRTDPTGQSIERQTALKEARQAAMDILTVWSTGAAADAPLTGSALVGVYLDYVQETFDHFLPLIQGRLGAQDASQGTSGPASASTGQIEVSTEDVGMFYQRCFEDFKWYSGRVRKELGVASVAEIVAMGFDEAYRRVSEAHGRTGLASGQEVPADGGSF